MYFKKLLPTGCGSPSFEGKEKKKVSFSINIATV